MIVKMIVRIRYQVNHKFYIPKYIYTTQNMDIHSEEEQIPRFFFTFLTYSR